MGNAQLGRVGSMRADALERVPAIIGAASPARSMQRAAYRPRRGERLGRRGRGRRSSRRPAPGWRRSTSNPTGSTSTSTAARPRRRRSRAAVVERGADVGFALDGDADRLIAVDGDGARSSTATRSSASSRSSGSSAARCRGGLVVSVLSNGGLQQRRRGGRGRGRAHARRRQVHPRGDAGVGRGARRREVRPRDRARAHDVRRRHRHRARSPARDDHTHRVARRHSPRRSRSCPQQQRAVKARHKDQWEGDPTLRRAIADAAARLGRRGTRPRPAVRHGTRLAGDGRGAGRGARHASWPTRSRPSRGSD